jgi:hypothetical protein
MPREVTALLSQPRRGAALWRQAGVTRCHSVATALERDVHRFREPRSGRRSWCRTRPTTSSTAPGGPGTSAVRRSAAFGPPLRFEPPRNVAVGGVHARWCVYEPRPNQHRGPAASLLAYDPQPGACARSRPDLLTHRATARSSTHAWQPHTAQPAEFDDLLLFVHEGAPRHGNTASSASSCPTSRVATLRFRFLRPAASPFRSLTPRGVRGAAIRYPTQGSQ